MLTDRLVIVGAITAVLVLAVVIGSAWLALGDSFRRVNSVRREEKPEEVEAPSPPPPPRPKHRYTPERTGRRWFSPEVLALLLVSLAAGLWLARLVGN